MIEKVKNELTELYEEAEKQIAANQSTEQVIVVKTAKDNIHYIANSPVKGDKEAENCFVQRLLEEEDIELKYIVCMWNEHCLDLPSMNFRKHLLEANPKNAEALMLLQGEGQLIVKNVEQTMS